MSDHFRDPGTRVTLGSYDRIRVEHARELLAETEATARPADAHDAMVWRAECIGKLQAAVDMLLRVVDQPPTP